jgi:hypothetical protein
MALKGPKMSKQGTAGKRKHVTICQELKIIWRFESGKCWKEVTASCSIGLIEPKGQIVIIYGIKWKYKGFFQVRANISTIVQGDVSVVYSRSFWRKPRDWACSIWKAKSFYGELTISDKRTFSESWLQNYEETAAEWDIEYFSDQLFSPSVGAVTKSYL